MSKKQEFDTTKISKNVTAVKSLTEAIAAKENAQGFRGTEVDPTPNENYTVAGVTSGRPTPETDADTAAAARDKTGIGLSPIEAVTREKASAAANAANTKKIKGVK